MSSKPILFNTEMVRAILEGRKTVTRRLIKPRYKDDEFGFQVVHNKDWSRWYVEKLNEDGGGFDETRYVNPPYRTGDLLYVRETWFYESHLEELTAGDPDLLSGRYSHRYVHRADRPDYPVNVGLGANGWRPSIYMPKEAARIWLRVMDVRVEKLQDLDEKSARKEGFINDVLFTGGKSAARHFADSWDAMIRKKDIERYGWEANPLVWVIEFERIEDQKGHG